MNKYFTLLFTVLTLVFAQQRSMAQGLSCVQMEPFCTDSGVTFPAGTNTTAEVGNGYGCLVMQPNPAWYYFEIATAGSLEIELTNSNSLDIDFIVWGPFTDLADAQSQCGALVAGADPFECDPFTSTCNNGVPCDMINPCVTGQGVDCSYDPQAVELVDIPNAQVGEVYLLMITNFSNMPTDITATQISGTGATDCSIVFCRDVDYNDITAGAPYDCTGGPINLTATPFTGVTPDVDSFITPAFGLSITTDANASLENSIEFWDGPNATGNLIGYWGPLDLGGNYLGPVPSNQNWIAFGEYFNPSGFYSIEWCDNNGTGVFPYMVNDFADGTILASGTFDHTAMNCFVVNVGAPTGTATFTGPGVTNNGDGTGVFDPAGLSAGNYDITYSWNEGDNGSGTFTI